MEVYTENARNGVYVVEEEELISKLETNYGYTIHPEPNGGIEGITVKQNGTIVNTTTAATVEKAYETPAEISTTLTVIPTQGKGSEYYIVEDGKYYKIGLSGAQITIGDEQKQVGGQEGSGPELTVDNATSLTKLEARVSGATTITVVGRQKGDETLTISYGGKNADVKVTVTETFAVNFYESSTAESGTQLKVASGGSAFTTEGYAVPKAPAGYKFDKWLLKKAVGANEVGSEATSLLENVTQDLNVYATYKDNKIYGATVLLNGNNSIKVGNWSINDNWKLFYIDDEPDGYVHLIYGDYYPAKAQTEIRTGTGSTLYCPAYKTKYYVSDYDFSVNSLTSRMEILRYLKNNSNYEDSSLDACTPGGSFASWSNLATALTGVGKPLAGKTILVQGAPNITMWKDSWNEQGYTELALDDTNNNATGYNIRLASSEANSNSNYYISLQDIRGKYDKLYFPYSNSSAGNENAGKANGYWLASPGGKNAISLCYASYLGSIHNTSFSAYDLCARPVISILKSDFRSISAFSEISITK